jgi:hypothetical protein
VETRVRGFEIFDDLRVRAIDETALDIVEARRG